MLGDESDDDPENIEKDERRDLEPLQKIANALVEFYGLKDVTRHAELRSKPPWGLVRALAMAQ